MNFRLRDAGLTLRLFITAFLFVLTTGYGTGLFFVEHTTNLSPEGVSGEFRGLVPEDPATDMKFEKSSREMYILIHDHILGLSLVFFALGSIFYFSSIVPEPLKRFLMVEPMVATLTTFGGIALVRFVAAEFSWLVIISGISLFVCYITMVILILAELWSSPKQA